jgi:hypothetical protein
VDRGVSIATRTAPVAPCTGPGKRGAGASDAGFGVEGRQKWRRARKAKPSMSSIAIVIVNKILIWI